ncbi:MAG: hypothetical protein PHV48_01875 [Candidatus Omnitrophica bacterium]|nr:hypothetical protein [Candidatus Omnitrophota bacterium]
MGFGMMELSFSLIVLGLGYIVLHLAGKSEGGLRILGKIIGRVMVVISAIILILTLYIIANVIVRSIIGNKTQMAQQERVIKPSTAARTAVR